jgi:alkylation response protein AidB-like acyl-CoA dehydrogenase
MNFQGFVLAGGAILKYGTEDQKQKYLRATLAAEILWCQLFSEPGSGSDLVSLSTRAEDRGDEWVVTGQKVWSSTAQLADHGILLARTDPSDPGHRGISFFLFDMHGPGVDVRPLKQMTGDHEFCEVFLDEARVAKADLLGPLNGGWGVATSVLADERAEVGAAGIALERRTQRLIDTVDATTDPVHRHRIMRVKTTAGALRQLLDRSEGDPRLGPLVKLGNTEFSTDRTRARIDGMGAAATVLADEAAVEEFLYAPGMRVAGGTSEIQRNLIGERLLGLPREPKPKKSGEA